MLIGIPELGQTEFVKTHSYIEHIISTICTGRVEVNVYDRVKQCVSNTYKLIYT